MSIAMLTGATGCTLLFSEQKAGVDDGGTVDAGVDAAVTDAEIWIPSVDWVSDTDSLFPAHIVQDDQRTIIIGSFSGNLITPDNTLFNLSTDGNIGFLVLDLATGDLTSPQQIGGTDGDINVVSVSKSVSGYSMVGLYKGGEEFCPAEFVQSDDCSHSAQKGTLNAFSSNYLLANIPDG
ncbi:MAG: hypothetical protein JKY56_24230, partial [Kofleriaceae bacterium]|nr:hypothetical protein [Kofleriaceae bacterium]